MFRGLKAELARTGKSQDIEFRQLSKYTAPGVGELLTGVRPPPVVPPAAASAVGAAWAAYTITQILRVNLLHYLSGELDGETELITSMTNIRDTCKRVGKTPEIFVAGYSQGAMAAHSVAYRLDQSNSNLASLLTGTALVADPFRVPNSALTNYGNAPKAANSWGICHALDDLPGNDSCRPGQLPRTAIPVPDRFRRSTVEVCDTGDTVCDTSRFLRTARIDRVIRDATGVHTACPGGAATVAASPRPRGGRSRPSPRRPRYLARAHRPGAHPPPPWTPPTGTTEAPPRLSPDHLQNGDRMVVTSP